MTRMVLIREDVEEEQLASVANAPIGDGEILVVKCLSDSHYRVGATRAHPMRFAAHVRLQAMDASQDRC